MFIYLLTLFSISVIQVIVYWKSDIVYIVMFFPVCSLSLSVQWYYFTILLIHAVVLCVLIFRDNLFDVATFKLLLVLTHSVVYLSVCSLC